MISSYPILAPFIFQIILNCQLSVSKTTDFSSLNRIASVNSYLWFTQTISLRNLFFLLNEASFLGLLITILITLCIASCYLMFFPRAFLRLSRVHFISYGHFWQMKGPSIKTPCRSIILFATSHPRVTFHFQVPLRIVFSMHLLNPHHKPKKYENRKSSIK